MEQATVKQARRRPRCLAVTSGKGGVGKTSMAVNLALCLRMLGAKVLLLDADVGLGSVDVLLDLHVCYDLRDVLLHGRPLEQTIVDGPRGLKILPGASGVEEMAAVAAEKLDAFFGALADYCAGMDFLVVDTAPGVSSQVVRCLMAADEVLLVTNPEPTALTDAYALLKVMSRRPEARSRRVSLVVNQIASREEAIRSYDRLRTTVEEFLDWHLDYLGSVAWDGTVSEASKRRVDFLTHYATAPCSRDVRKLAARLISRPCGGPAAESADAASTDPGRFFREMMEGADG
jgi:flagellar biosynthesis protein FlhG